MLNVYRYHNEPKSLSGHENAYKFISPDDAYVAIKKKDFSKATEEQLMDRIVSDAGASVMYAIHALGRKRFPAGEAAIATDPKYSTTYAVEVLHGAFPKGEKIIASDARSSIIYATHAIKKPFPLGEHTIKTAGSDRLISSNVAEYNHWMEQLGFDHKI